MLMTFPINSTRKYLCCRSSLVYPLKPINANINIHLNVLFQEEGGGGESKLLFGDNL